MRIAAVYDIHANLPALEAVVDDIRRAGVDQVLVGGDVLPGPMPTETIDCLRNLDVPVQFIRGNGDREALNWMRGNETAAIPDYYREPMRWVARQLRPDDEPLLAGWPLTTRVEVTGVGEVVFCHATPRDDNEIFTRLTADERLLPIFDTLGVPLVVCGHTHMQFDRVIGRTRVVNAGSVGMPFGATGAFWLLLGPGVQLRRTEYDLERAAARIRATKYPQAEAFASGNVLQAPSEAAILEGFTRAELR